MALRGIINPAMPSILLSPDLSESDPLVSLERGGIALNDATQGLDYQDWRCYIEGGVVKVTPVLGGTVTSVFTPTGVVTSLSLAFDTNMAVTIAYVEDGLVKLRWFNTTLPGIQTDTIAGATGCKCGTDEKRRDLEGLSDVIFAYLRAGNLYYRQQRDRYLIEYLVGAVGASFKLRRVGKNVGNRFQFELST